MIDFRLTAEPLFVILTAVSFISMVLLAVVYPCRLWRLVKTVREGDRLSAGSDAVALPPLSVIVYVRDNSEELAAMLPMLLAQEYPAGFEVIAAIDGRSEHAVDVVKLLSVEHRNLRMTFVPEQAHALSRKKLSLSLGIKGARHEHIVLTDATVRIPSYQWLQQVGNRFADGSDVVLGYASPAVATGGTGDMRRFDLLSDYATMLTAAAGGHPYRAFAANLAFTKSRFDAVCGFAGSVGFHHGEDDIFVQRICRDANVSLMLAPQTRLAQSARDNKAAYRIEKFSHYFTGSHVRKGPRRVAALFSVIMWLWLAVTVLSGIMGYPNLFPLTVSIFLGVVWMSALSAVWCKVAKLLDFKIRSWKLPALMFIRPVYNAILKWHARSDREFNYTWTRGH